MVDLQWLDISFISRWRTRTNRPGGHTNIEFNHTFLNLSFLPNFVFVSTLVFTQPWFPPKFGFHRTLVSTELWCTTKSGFRPSLDPLNFGLHPSPPHLVLVSIQLCLSPNFGFCTTLVFAQFLFTTDQTRKSAIFCAVS